MIRFRSRSPDPVEETAGPKPETHEEFVWIHVAFLYRKPMRVLPTAMDYRYSDAEYDWIEAILPMACPYRVSRL